MDAFGLVAAAASPDALIAHVSQRLTTVPTGATVVIGCSGGPDSVALTHLVWAARPDLTRVVAYVDHGLQATDSQQQVVLAHATATKAACETVRVTVAGDGHGVEAAARDQRYMALYALAKRHGAAGLLVGHTADDLAETVWMRLLRGSGPDGLSAMRERDGLLLRPLLSVRRETVHRYVSTRGLATVHDPMNDDETFLRVRIRHTLRPVLDTLSDDPVAAAWRLSQLADTDQAFFGRLIADAPILRFGAVAASIDRAYLQEVDRAVGSRIVRTLLHHVRPTDGFTSRHSSANDVFRVLDADPPARFCLTGDVALMVDAHTVTVARNARQDPVTFDAHDSGAVALFGARLGTVNNDRFHPPPYGDADRYRVWLAGIDRLTVRCFAPGDRLHMHGGDRPVKTLFQAGRLPVLLRAHWPVVCVNDTVVWVPGFGVDDRFAGAKEDASATLFTFTADPADE